MKNSQIKMLRRNLIAAAVAIAMANSVVHADLSVGSIFGEVEQGVPVTVVNLETGLKRSLTADGSGRFNFSQLPTGRYKVSAKDVSYEVSVAPGTGTPVNFTGELADRLTIVGTTINPIDISSVESSTVFTAEQLERLPVGRDISDVAMLAPGTVRGDSGFGKLASFGGASVAENGYYINGFDVTNARNFLSYASVPFDAIGEQQIKTGGFGAEYGRALGGVVNIVTKRGSNEWKLDASVIRTPSSLTEPEKDVVSRYPDAVAGSRGYYSTYRSDDVADELSYSVSGGGALIADKLFIYGILEGRDVSSDTYTNVGSQTSSNTSPNALIKIDWYLSDNHILEFTGIRNVEETEYRSYQNVDGEYYTGHHGAQSSEFTERNGGNVLIGKYTGHLSDDFTVGLMLGKLTSDAGYVTPDPLPGADCPVVDIYDQDTDDVTDVGCWDYNQVNVRTAGFGPDIDERKAIRLDAEWSLADHSFRFGYDDETFTSSRAGTTYSGGYFYRRYTPVDVDDSWNGVDVAAGSHVVRQRTRERPSGSYEVQNSALYVEDSWYVADDWLIYAGLRSESFDNFNADGISFVSAKNMLAPRLGFSWDVNGDASAKVFANAGRYHIPIAANTNIRASNWQHVETRYFLYDGTVDTATQAPTVLGSQLGDALVSGRNSSPVPGTVASTDLEPMFQDELILGYQRDLGNHWSAGLRFIAREVKNGVDDYCGRQAFVDFAADNAYTDFDPATLSSCIIINPGRDLHMAMDVNNDGNLQNVVVSNSYLQLADYKRTYKALELFWERSREDGWYLQGSYVYAKSEGNSEGLVNSWLEDAAPGLTNDFDHKVFVDGTDGYLSNDRRHTLKLFGAYELTEQWEISASLLVQSGRPVSCFGYTPFDVNDPEYEVFERYSASTLYCRDENGNQVLGQRGDYGRTPWIYNMDASLSYSPNWAEGLLMQATVFNVFDSRRVTEYQEAGDVSLESSGQNANFLNDLNYQSPRSVQFTVRYSF